MQLKLNVSENLLCLFKDDITGHSSEDDICEGNTGSARQLRSSSLTRDRHSYASSDGLTSQTTASPPTCTSAVQFASSPGCGASFTQTPAIQYQGSISTNHSSTSASSSSSHLPVCSLESCPSTSQPSTSSLGGATSIDPTLVLTYQNSSSSPYQSSTPSTSTQHQPANYDNYLSVMAALSDMSSDDEELNQAILASLQTERLAQNANVLW